MRLSDAKSVIAGKNVRPGFCVHFEVRARGLLASDFFPDIHAGEPGIPTEEEAWGLAASFAHAKHVDEVVNVYVISADTFMPVPGYEGRTLKKYPRS